MSTKNKIKIKKFDMKWDKRWMDHIVQAKKRPERKNPFYTRSSRVFVFHAPTLEGLDDMDLRSRDNDFFPKTPNLWSLTKKIKNKKGEWRKRNGKPFSTERGIVFHASIIEWAGFPT